MSESKHTPGPWVVTPGIDGNSVTVRQSGIHDDGVIRKPVAEVWHNGDDVAANARLIAAAPELLAELKRLVHAYVSLLESGRDRIISLGGQCDPVDVMEAGNPWLRAAKEAIAKAERSK